METRTEKDIPTTSAYSPAKGYIPHVAVSGPPPPPPYALHHNSAPAPAPPGVHSISGLISPPTSHSTESRRPSDDPHHDYALQHQRQSLPSLPSISEALHFPPRSAAGPPSAPPATHAPPPPHSHGSNPYSHAPPPPPAARPYTYDERPYPPNHSHHMRRSPPPPHPAPAYAPSSQYAPASERSQPLPALRTALPSQAAPHSPYYHPEASRYEQDPRRMDPPREDPRPARAYDDRYHGYPTAATNAYAAPYPPRPRSPAYQSSAPYSRADLPRPPYGCEDMGRPPMGVKRDYEHGEPEHLMMFQRQLEHNLGNHDFEMALGELQQCGMDVSRISEEILETVRRYRNEPDAQGMPAMKYHDQMLGCQRKLDDAFTQVKHFMAQQQRQMEDHHSMKARGGKGEGYGDDEHWGMDKDQNFNGPDQKKIRRGQRAAPPGRCHSCNRAETPEWRRGPDGARTLCNACGLHYAKLTRRMGSKNAASAPGSALRPKSIDGSPM